MNPELPDYARTVVELPHPPSRVLGRAMVVLSVTLGGILFFAGLLGIALMTWVAT